VVRALPPENVLSFSRRPTAPNFNLNERDNLMVRLYWGSSEVQRTRLNRPFDLTRGILWDIRAVLTTFITDHLDPTLSGSSPTRALVVHCKLCKTAARHLHVRSVDDGEEFNIGR